jgi:protein-S-isoprenylcysteine O-methyltransferase Ste14
MKTDVMEIETGAEFGSFATRFAGMAYALLAYNIGAGALFWLFFAAGGFAPYGINNFTAGNPMMAVAVNVVLVFIFGLQHTIMARRSFKRWINQFLPAYLERSNFVMLSGIAMAFLVWNWQTLPGSVWQVENGVAQILIMAGYVGGILYVLLTSLITNHFELFGLRQAWINFCEKEYTPLEFKKIWFYKYSRHPMMLGLLFVFWCTPDMSVTRLALAILMTVYLFAGIKFEETGLIQEFGDKYREYKNEIGLFFTLNK